MNNVKILKNESLSNYTFTKTGGPAEMLAFPTSIMELQMLLTMANNKQIPVTVIGNASNLIIRDGGIQGLVIILTEMHQITVNNNFITAQAGARYIDTTIVAQQHSLSGIEFAAGIPGSIGGAIFMNAGAYGGETANVVDSITVLTPQNEIKHLNHDQINFGYRYSVVQDKHYIVLDATFKLSLGDSAAIKAEMNHLNDLRQSKQPLESPSCGSVFKRPTGYFAGKLIHDAGLQGYQVGGAQVSTKHAGFIVNINNATATDYLNVIKHVQQVVYKQNQVHLETEVRIIGQDEK